MLKLNLANLQLFAHKKGGGSTSNGRDSQAKRLGAKAADGQTVTGVPYDPSETDSDGKISFLLHL